MYPQEPCGNTQAEIENDKWSESAGRQLIALNSERWKLYVDQLLHGKPVEHGVMTYTLKEWLVDEYQEFADFADKKYDFMAVYVNGGFKPELRNLIESEAKVLASIIVG